MHNSVIYGSVFILLSKSLVLNGADLSDFIILFHRALGAFCYFTNLLYLAVEDP